MEKEEGKTKEIIIKVVHMQTMANIQIAVDDFGIGELANKRILTLVLEGRVNRVAVMVHGRISPDEIAVLLRSGVFLDVHLDIVSGINPERKISDGVLGRLAGFLRRYIVGEHSRERVRAMWEEQSLQFQKMFGRFPDGLNTHEHIHFFPPFFLILIGLAEKYAISYVRMGQRGWGSINGVAIILDALRFFNRNILKKMHCETSTFLVSADWTSNLEMASIQKRLKSGESAEVIFHPEREEEYKYLVTM
jgi:predicted glycoside hydrolase/deacetylase ChbG (UPF0249 family)